MSKGFDGLIEKVNSCGVKKVAVAVAQDAHVLEAVRAAKERNIAEAVNIIEEYKFDRDLVDDEKCAILQCLLSCSKLFLF